MRLTQDELESYIRDEVRKINKAYHPAAAGSGGSGDDGGFENLGEFALAVAKAARNRGDVDDRLIKAAASPASHEYEPDYGGFLVPTDFMAQLLEVAVEASPLLKPAMIIPMAKSSINIPCFQAMDRSGGTLYGGLSAQWITEEGTITGVRPKIGTVGLRLRKLATLAFVSNELLEDSPISIEPLFKRIFSTTIQWSIEEAVINGTGAGQPQGIMSTPSLITVTAETGQHASTILYENVLNMYARLWDKNAGVWFCNHDCLPQLATMNLQVGVGGGPVWMPAGGASQKPYNTLMGLPLNFTEHCQSVGTTGDILLLDMSQYILGQKSGGPRFDTSAHLEFLNDQMAYRVIMRLDGQGWWSSALTPRHGATLSPFVALATRS